MSFELTAIASLLAFHVSPMPMPVPEKKWSGREGLREGGREREREKVEREREREGWMDGSVGR